VFGFLGMSAASDRTLRKMGFKELEPDHPLRATVNHLSAALAIPPPQVGTVPVFNAFAMGMSTERATVAIGIPMIEALTPEQLEAIIGHELGHIASGDMRRMMLMRTFQNALVWYAFSEGMKQFARWVMSWAAELAILAFSREREYWADAIGAALTSKEAMIGALSYMEDAPPLTSDEKANARFMFRGKLFSTHPGTWQRIHAVREEIYMRRLPRQRVIENAERPDESGLK
jgi:heat shock protein HtpX